jgi:hypothetical protein
MPMRKSETSGGFTEFNGPVPSPALRLFKFTCGDGAAPDYRRRLFPAVNRISGSGDRVDRVAEALSGTTACYPGKRMVAGLGRAMMFIVLWLTEVRRNYFRS